MNKTSLVHCDFCGYDFDPNCGEQVCSACPLSGSCGKITCPRCGYPVLPEAALIKFSKAVWNKLNKQWLKYENQ